MLFSEFVEGTGCRETDHNYKVYKELEIIYMNTDCTKEHIYEMGKKLVDNSKTEEELELEAKIKAEIKEYREEKKYYENRIKAVQAMLVDEADPEWIKEYKRMLKLYRGYVKDCKIRISELNWVLA